ncbi:MAG TPA: ABC transporter permease [Blastocatellia bacterium]|nr:ABC transporter permease [Blastocatellia bacterium]
MFQDLRYVVRVLRKQPGFTLICVLTLTLGIGATAAVFSLIYGVLLTPPPYRNPEQLELILPARTGSGDSLDAQGLAAQQWTEWQQESKSFESIAAYNWNFSFLIRQDGSESIQGMMVTRNYFSTMGLEPILGRTFSESEVGPKAPPVIILGYDLWKQKFNGDPAIVGQTIRLSRAQTPPTVIGVMPPGVRFLPSPRAAKEPNYDLNALVDYWIAGYPNPERMKAPSWNVIARLKTGTTLKEAQAELSTIAARQGLTDQDFSGLTARLQPLPEFINHDGRRILLPLMGAAALVLLIACGNVAALLLVRGLQRRQEYAIRCALGASRATLFRQVCIESLTLALAGGVLGIGLAFGIVKIFKLIGGYAIPRLDLVSVGWPSLVCGLVSAVLAALMAGLYPAWRDSRLNAMQAMKSAGPKASAGRADRRLLRGVTMVQTALTLTLLVGAGLLIRTMGNLARVQTGYSINRILTMSVTAVQGDWNYFHTRALERVASLPGVEHAAFAWGVPLTGNHWPGTVEIEGQPVTSRQSERRILPIRAITPDYFKVLGLSMTAGREFRDTDKGDKLDVAIVNQALVDRYFQNAEPIGKKIWVRGIKEPSTEIVGVVANGRTDDLTQTAGPEIYLSLWEATAYSKHLVVRASGDPRSLVASVGRELRAIDPTVSVENIKTLEQVRADSLASRIFAMRLLIGFSIVASILTLVGIYGVLSLSVASRRREIAIRTAVGAGSRDILSLVLGEGFRLIVIGVLGGLAAAIAFSRILKTFLFGVEPTDPVTLIIVGLLFIGVALFSCWIPARRATRVDPIEALRDE